MEEKEEIANVKIEDLVEPQTSKTLHQSITIPPVPPSHLHNCSIIDLRYFCKVRNTGCMLMYSRGHKWLTIDFIFFLFFVGITNVTR